MDLPENRTNTSEDRSIKEQSADRDQILELNFVPMWARKEPTANPYVSVKKETRPRQKSRALHD
ncbi:MAG: hypothetical protein GKR87_07995 [Kiritimatiellae bacterium]|nr:hypothetical protein [Kiritimatiellia bacterium]